MMNTEVFRWMGIKTEDRRKLTMLAPVFFLCAISEILNYNGYFALFNQRFGTEYLPYIYAAEAVILPFEAWLLSWLTGKLRKPQLMGSLFVLMGVVITLNAIALLGLRLSGKGARLFYPFMFLTSSFVVRQQTLLLWSLAFDLCPTQQAKRLMPTFVSASALGGIAAGFIAQVVGASLGADAVYMLAPLFLLAGSVNYWRAITRYLVPLTLKTPLPDGEAEGGKGFSSLHIFKKMFTWPYLLTAALIMTVMPGLYFLMEYEFLLTAGAVYTSEAEFASFLGFVTTLLFTLALVLQLVIGRISSWLGPSNVLAVIAVVFLIGFASLIFSLGTAGMLIAASLTYMLGYLLLYYVAEPANQMFFKLLPFASRDAYRFVVMGVTASAGILLGAVLQWLHGGLGFDSQQLALVGLAGAVALVLLAVIGRRLYMKELIRSVQVMTREEPDLGASLAEFAGKAQFRSVLREFLSEPNDYAREIALELIGQSRDPSFVPDLLALLDDPGARVRIAALRALDLTDAGTDLLDKAARGLVDPDYEVRRQAVYTFARAHLQSQCAADHVRPLLKDRVPQVITAALKVLHVLNDIQSSAAREEAVERMLHEGGDPVVALCEMIAESGLSGYERELEELLLDENPSVRSASIETLGALRHTASIKPMVELLNRAEPVLHETTVRALMRMGPGALEPLYALLQQLRPAAWSAAIRVLAQLSDDQSCRERLIPEVIMMMKRLWSWREVIGALQIVEHRGLAELAAMRLHEFRGFALDGAWAVMERVADEMVSQAVRTAAEDDDEEVQENGLELLAEGLGDKRLAAAMLQTVSAWEDFAAVSDDEALNVLRNIADHEDPWLRQMAEAGLQAYKGEDEVSESRPLLGLLDKIVFLKQVPFFSALSLEELGRVAEIADEQFHTAGTRLFLKGTVNDTLGVIIEGRLKISVFEPSGGERLITVLKRKYVYGEASSLYGTLATANGTADTEGLHILAVSGSKLNRLIRLYPGIGIGILRIAFDRIRRLEDFITDTPVIG